MRSVFFVYWTWHCSLLIMQANGVVFIEHWQAILFAVLKEGNLAFISLAMVIGLITIKKASRNDYNFLIACLASTISRFSIKIVGIAFSQAIWVVLILDLLVVPLYFILKNRLERVSNYSLIQAYENEHD